MTVKPTPTDAVSSSLSVSRAVTAGAVGGYGAQIRRVDSQAGSAQTGTQDQNFNLSDYDEASTRDQPQREQVQTSIRFGDVLATDAVRRTMLSQQTAQSSRTRPALRVGISAYQRSNITVQTRGYMSTQGATINRVL